MRYVMVPVPREFVLDVMRLVLFRAPEDDGDSDLRDEARVTKLWGETDELGRRVLQLVAKATLEDAPLRLNDAADELETDAASVSAAVRDLNAHGLGGGREVVRVRAEPAVGVGGRTGKIAHLAMRPEVARMVRAASKADTVPSP